MKLRAHLFDEGRPSSRPLAGRFELLGGDGTDSIGKQCGGRWDGGQMAYVGLSAKAPFNLTRETNAQQSLGFDYRIDLAPAVEIGSTGQFALCVANIRLQSDTAAAMSCTH